MITDSKPDPLEWRSFSGVIIELGHPVRTNLLGLLVILSPVRTMERDARFLTPASACFSVRARALERLYGNPGYDRGMRLELWSSHPIVAHPLIVIDLLARSGKTLSCSEIACFTNR